MKNQAFTLVELIVVITILAVLGRLGFMSFQGYAKTSRDTVRVSDLKLIEKALEFEITKNDILPYPDNYITLTASGTILGYQGYAGTESLGRIGISDKVLDPKDETEYTYSTNTSRTKYQLLGFLEAELSQNIYTQSYADFSTRIPLLKGTELGILVDDVTRIPVQGLGIDIDVQNTIDSYGIFVNNRESLSSGTGEVVSKILNSRIYPNGTCKNILKNGNSRGDGIYTINPNGSADIEVYCNMSLQGGGWTLLFNRKAEKNGEVINNIEDCGGNINEFINGISCGSVNNISENTSYSIGGTIKQKLMESTFSGKGIEFMVHQFYDNIPDLDDTFIISSNEDIFPDSTFPLKNITINSVCNLYGDCDAINVLWKYLGDYHYGNTVCMNNGGSSSPYGGMYGYCLNGLDTSSSNTGLLGDRDYYNHVKLWNHSNMADDFQERVFIR